MYVIRPIALTDSILTSSNVAETDYAAWDVGTAYVTGNRCIVISTHKIYEAIANVTGGSSPEIDVLTTTPKWIAVGATNRWKAYDKIIGSKTSQSTSITYKITPGEIFDAIAFLGLDAVSVRVVITDPIEGVVYDETKELLTTVLTGTSLVMDWYTYFFSSIIRITDFVFLDIPLYLNAVMDITITYTGGTASVGEIVFGQKTRLGVTKADPNPTFGTVDFSTKEQDTFGNWQVVKRSFSKKMTCSLIVNNTVIDEIERLLSAYLSELLVWIGDEQYGSMIIYGYCKDHNASAGLLITEMAIEIEGLT